MGSVTVKFKDKSPKKDGTCAVQLQIIINRKKLVWTVPDFSCKITDWNFSKNLPKKAAQKNAIEGYVSQARIYICEAEENELPLSYVKERLAGKIMDQAESYTLRSFADVRLHEYRVEGNEGLRRAYRDAFNSVDRYSTYMDTKLEDVSYDGLQKLKRSLGEHLSNNSIRAVLSKVQALYNEADKREIFPVKNRSPFKKGIIPTLEKTKKRAITRTSIEDIEARYEELQMEIQHKKFKGIRERNSCERHLRGVESFLLGFYLRGMDLVDLLHLTKDEVSTDYIIKKRHKLRRKGGGELEILIASKARTILDGMMDRHEGKFVMMDEFEDEQIQFNVYKANYQWLNKGMKEVGLQLELANPLTSKVARHTFATTLRRNQVPFSEIQQLMGHAQNTITDVYLQEEKQAIIDKYHLEAIKDVRCD